MSLQSLSWPARVLVVVCFGDVLLHAVTAQFELLRALACLGIVLWVQAWPRRRVGWAAIAAYVAVNLWFVATAGFVNPDTGMPRVLWLALVSLTLGASALHVRTQHSGRS
jgi:hypothetical protein